MRTLGMHTVLAAVAVVGTACMCEEVLTVPVASWDAVLSGQEVVPPPNPASTASGEAGFTLTAAGDSIAYTISISSAPASAFTQAHLHQAAPGANGPIAIWLCGTPGNAGPAGTPTCSNVSTTGVMHTGKVAVSAAQLNAIRSYGMYLDIHTVTNVDGEIRGQVRIVPVFSDC